MRDVLTTLIFLYGARHTLKNPYYGVLLWIWIGLMNPHRLGWGFAYSTPFAMFTVVITVVSMFAHMKEVRWPGGKPLNILILMLVWMGLTTAMSIHFDASLERYLGLLKILVITIVLSTLIHSRNQIIGVVWVTAGSLAYFGVKGGWFTIRTGGSARVWGPPDSVIEGNNELAVALVMTIPLVYYLIQQVSFVHLAPFMRKFSVRSLRYGLGLVIVLCAFSALGSHSRGALLAMVAMSSVLWWRSKSKLGIGIALLILAPVLIAFMPDEWTQRMHTMETYDQDESAMGRINAWTMAFNIANDRIFGAGFATDSPLIFRAYAPNPNFVIVAHSIYFQILGAHGYIGLFLFLAFWGSTYACAGRIIRLTKARAEMEWANQLASAMKVSLIGFAVGGAFLSLAYWDMPYYITIILVVTEKWVKDQLSGEGLTSPAALAPAAEGMSMGGAPAPSRQEESDVEPMGLRRAADGKSG